MKAGRSGVLLVAMLLLALLVASIEQATLDRGALTAATGTQAATAATQPRKSQGQGFTVCEGTYALCTTAKCTQESNDATLSCGCDVKQGWSAGQQSCEQVPKAAPTQGLALPSRYAPIKRMAVCLQARPWAWCLDMACTVDANTKKATCKCTATPDASYVVVTDRYDASTCAPGIIWSSATVQDVLQITAFLEDKPQLKPHPISIVGVGAATK